MVVITGSEPNCRGKYKQLILYMDITLRVIYGHMAHSSCLKAEPYYLQWTLEQQGS